MNSPEVNSTCLNDPANTCILKYSGHASTKLSRENISFANPFTSSEKTESNIVREILKLNPKRPGTFGNNPTKVLNKSFTFEMLEKLCFSQNLKLLTLTCL